MEVPGRGCTVWYERCVQLFPSAPQLSGRLLPEALAVVALGGAAGAGARWVVGDTLGTTEGVWPWATLLVNVVGCALIGLAARRLTRGSLAWDFLVTGGLGGFTTMSAFAVELNGLVDADRTALAVLYGLLSIAAGVAATFVAAPALPPADGDPP
ncbi:MAG: CrcB family protein [Ilumatobacter sp.]|nr:CrcB family protein [Ilumatobacter sp.]